MKAILVSVAAAASLLLTACGPDHCGDLKKQCDGCANTTQKAACNTAHTTYTTLGGSGAQDACKALVDLKTFASDGVACKAQ
jgi:hypothetical protein